MAPHRRVPGCALDAARARDAVLLRAHVPVHAPVRVAAARPDIEGDAVHGRLQLRVAPVQRVVVRRTLGVEAAEEQHVAPPHLRCLPRRAHASASSAPCTRGIGSSAATRRAASAVAAATRRSSSRRCEPPREVRGIGPCRIQRGRHAEALQAHRVVELVVGVRQRPAAAAPRAAPARCCRCRRGGPAHRRAATARRMARTACAARLPATTTAAAPACASSGSRAALARGLQRPPAAGIRAPAASRCRR